VYADDANARVELSTKCKIMAVERSYVKELKNPEEGKQNNDGGRSNYGGG
jgi:hypothetical protein